MDAAEDEKDEQLQRQSPELLADLEKSLRPFLWKRVRADQCDVIRRKVRVRDADRLVALLEPFQEQPQLLDPHLKNLVPILADAFLAYLNAAPLPNLPTNDSAARAKLLMPVSRAICKILYTFCKIRGEKVIVRFFSTETRHLELLLSAIETGGQSGTARDQKDGLQSLGDEDSGEASAQIDDDAWDWEERYITLLWLSQLLLAPFDLATISSEQSQNMTPPEIKDLQWPLNVPALTLRVVPLAVRYLSSSGKESASAKRLLVRVAMRRDMQELGIFDALVQWAIASLNEFSPKSPPSSTYHYTSILSFVGGLLVSSAGTSNMNLYLIRISEMIESIFSAEQTTTYSHAIQQSPVARKSMVKILRQTSILALQNPEEPATDEIIQNSIGILLEMLSDTATHVRLAASKALSVIAVKLDPDQASEVVDAVLEGLEKNAISLSSITNEAKDLSRVNQNEWHGLIMTISHLLYRRTIPFMGLPRIIEALRRGLSFEQRSSTGASVGINVRDAANFGIWSLARRYSTIELQGAATRSSEFRWDDLDASETSVLQSLASELVTAASLDPAGNVRRGSSAALQELIGRHPNIVENGIAVVQVVDYHAVALRSRAIREVAPKGAVLSRYYRVALLTGLLGWRGVKDADASARRNAAFAVGKILWEQETLNDNYNPFINLSHNFNIIKGCLDRLAHREVETRHGIILCLAEIFNLIFPDCSQCQDMDRICLGHSSARPLEGAPSRLRFDLIIYMREILESLWKLPTSRKPELLAEAVSKLIYKGLPLLSYTSLYECDKEFLGESYKITERMSTDEAFGIEDLPCYDSPDNNPNHEIIHNANLFMARFLIGDHPDAIDAVSDAAATLLFYVSEDVRRLVATSIKTAASQAATMKGATSIYTLFKLLNSDTKIDILARKEILQTFFVRWHVRNPPDILIREIILERVAHCKLVRIDKSAFIPMIVDGLNDYTTTTRGDIGSKPRIAASKAAASFMIIAAPDRLQVSDLIDGEKELFSLVIRAAAEKLDRVRAEGQRAIVCALRERIETAWIRNEKRTEKENSEYLEQQKFVDFLQDLSCSSQDWFYFLLGMQNTRWWKATAATAKNKWNLELMSGYVTSAGAGSEDVLRSSRAALVKFCMSPVESDSSGIEKESGKANLVCTTLIELLKTSMANADERVLIPTLEVLAFLMDMRVLQKSMIDFKALHTLTRRAQVNSKNIRKIEACIKLYGGLIETYPPAMKSLSAMLTHRFPKIRSIAVEEMWVRLDGVSGDQSEGKQVDVGKERLKGFDWIAEGKEGRADRIEAVLDGWEG